MLDPVKVSIVSPGVAESGGLEANGVPAAVLAAYLRARGITVEKTTDFTVLILFSIGITKGKWGTLLNALLEFKRDHTRNAPLVEVLPHLVGAHAESYAGWGLRDLADAMFAHLHDSRHMFWLAAAFATLPEPVMTPRAAHQRLVRGDIEHVALDSLAGRVLATSVIPQPPGMPMLMPGESTGAADGPYLGYLRALASWDRRFPGFAHDVRGVVSCRGDYYVQCVATGAGDRWRREVAGAAVGAR
jgi:arginine/lysine/ornithine decarboxylase